MTSKHYKQILVNEYETQELSKEDFEDTLNFYTKLIKEENQIKVNDMWFGWLVPIFIVLTIIVISILLANLVHL